ncbi:M56 family metallopeptidase [Winogradskyella forsetii]|uniref:M56 family metallopeptidase n=1 Tax=Winogradskyella forsetii TaxID=2686077 RepID=UPI0015B7A40B|nr:M56 family metallopeptidase [Winogradskyella forsetii]
MELYLLKFSACLLVFWLVYVLFLERQTMHHFKRFYLLGAMALALVIPTLTITEYVEPVVTNFETSSINIPTELSEIEPIETPSIFTLEHILWLIYGMGVLLFFIRFVVNLVKMQRRISKNVKLTKRSFVYVLLRENLVPHSFFKYIFFNKMRYESNSVPAEVKLHEETHAKQLHSLDIIILELLQIVFWFHPLIYILKHHVKLNHEFLADQGVLKQGSDAKTYQNIILQFSSSDSYRNTQDYALSSAINYSSTRLNGLFSKNTFGQVKKRFRVMKKQTSKTRIWLSTLLVLPIIAVLFYSFAERIEIEKEIPNPQIIVQKEQPLLTILINKNGELLVNDELATIKAIASKLKSLSEFANSTKAVYVKYDPSEASKKALEKIKTMVIDHEFKIIIADASSTAIPPPPPPAPPAAPKKTNSPKKGGPNANNYEVAKTNSNQTIKPVEILIKRDNSITLNNEPVSFKNLLDTVTKINEHLTIEERRNYVTASIFIEQNKSMDFAKKVQSELRKTDIWSSFIIHKENQKKFGLLTKHFSPNNGLTIEEAKVEKEKALKEMREDQTSKDSPWSIEMGTAIIVENEEQKQGPIKIDGESYYYSDKNEKTTYYNRFGKEVEMPTNTNKSSTSDPESTLDFVIRMAKNNAKFFNEGKSISSDIAIDQLKKNPKLNVTCHNIESKQPLVYIFKKPILLGANGKSGKQQSLKLIINGKKVDFPKLTMTKIEVNSLKLTTENGNVTEFKLKIPGKPTILIKGNSFDENKNVLTTIASMKTDMKLVLFSIKDASESKIEPLVITIID